MQSKRVNTVINKMIKDQEVYNLLLNIPLGNVATYGDLAKALDHPSASRLIGKILGRNPNPVKVPCHRIVLSNGKLGGYIHGIAKKKELLEKEGILFKNNTTIYDFKNVRFCPQHTNSN